MNYHITIDENGVKLIISGLEHLPYNVAKPTIDSLNQIVIEQDKAYQVSLIPKPETTDIPHTEESPNPADNEPLT